MTDAKQHLCIGDSNLDSFPSDLESLPNDHDKRQKRHYIYLAMIPIAVAVSRKQCVLVILVPMTGDTQTDYFTPCACVRGKYYVIDVYIIEYLVYMYHFHS